MAYIKVLKDEELIGGTDNTEVYPVTTSQALYRQNPDGTVPTGIKHQKLEDSLQDIETDVSGLYNKTEKLVVYLNNDKDGQTLEITGEPIVMTLEGSASIETFGDEPSISIAPEDMQEKRMRISSSSADIYDEPVVTTTYPLLNVVGTYTSTFTCKYNDIEKSASSITNVNLRKFVGFAENQPSDTTSIEALQTIESIPVTNSIDCTVTVKAINKEFKPIYFAIPKGMLSDGVKPTVLQPDALNAPLEISSQLAIINRIIGGSSYEYRLFKTIDEIDTTVNKRLTIS